MSAPATAPAPATAARAEIQVRTFDLGARVRWHFYDAAGQVLADREELPRSKSGELLYPVLPVSFAWSDEQEGWQLLEAKLEISVRSGASIVKTTATIQQSGEDSAPPIDRSDFGVIQISRNWEVTLLIEGRDGWRRTFVIQPQGIDVREKPPMGLPGTIVPAGAADVGN